VRSKAYNEAVEEAEVIFSYSSHQPETVERLVALGYRAGVADSTAALYQSASAEKSDPKRTLITFHEKLAAIARRLEVRAKELRV
jgi:hypothetical protein